MLVLLCLLTYPSSSARAADCQALGPDTIFDAKSGFLFQVARSPVCRNETSVRLRATLQQPGESQSGARPEHSVASPHTSADTPSVPLFCRRDDHIFLPPTSQAGLPCGTTITQNHV